MATLTLGRVHWKHPTRDAYCGTESPQRFTDFETRVTCLHCLKAYDIEIAVAQRRADTYTTIQEQS